MVTAAELMDDFARQTLEDGVGPERRYLWTDAFAVCNFLGLGQLERAEALAARVHRVLGRHRPDEPVRRGWLSDLPEVEGAAHPTLGGLRIGKPLPERSAIEPFDPTAEWDLDGQYFHYLTKWMIALDHLARATGEPHYLRWGRELADVASRRFVYGPPHRRRMSWKLSVDLTRVLVGSMGQHDPLEGYLTCRALEATARAAPPEVRGEVGPELVAAAADFRGMIDVHQLGTVDPLGLGELLVGAHRLTALGGDADLVDVLVRAAAEGYRRYLDDPDRRTPADYRLAFRELGLAIGLATLPAATWSAVAFPLHATIRAGLLRFWSDAAHRRLATYLAHADINNVMLATALAPDGYLAARAWPPRTS